MMHLHDQVLLVTRRQSNGWMVPGGGVELGEEVEHAAVRELEEEVCLCSNTTSQTRGSHFHAANRCTCEWDQEI